jgi:hypothetical protein
MLSEDEGKVERELFVVREADEEGGWAVAVRRRLGVLQMVFSMASHTGAPETERPYLDVVNHTFVAKVSPCAIASCGKGIGRDIQERATAGIADVECSNRDWRRVSMRHTGAAKGGSWAIHRVWSRRYRASFSPALLLTAPMPKDSGGCRARASWCRALGIAHVALRGDLDGRCSMPWPAFGVERSRGCFGASVWRRVRSWCPGELN